MQKYMCILALLFTTLNVPVALADTIQIFSVNIDYPFNSTIGGTVTIDVTNGTITAADITTPYSGLDFTIVRPSMCGGGGCLRLSNGDDLILDLFFTTTNPNSLVGFAGGTIEGGDLFVFSDGILIVPGMHGSIEPAPIPEPSTMLLLGTGLLTIAASVRCRLLLRMQHRLKSPLP